MLRPKIDRKPLRGPAAWTRRGVSAVVGAFALTASMAAVAVAVDLGVVSLTRTKMQSGTDAAALAGAMEITHAIQSSGPNVQDVFAYAQAQARTTAAKVAQLNGIYVDPDRDIVFGRRHKAENGQFVFDWNAAASQTNVVKVTARRDNPDVKQPDGKLPALFSAVMGNTGSAVTANSAAYIEPRDLVVVHDFSRSMNFDSYFSDEVNNPLPKAQIEETLLGIYNQLQPLNLGSMPYQPKFISSTKSNTGASATVTFKGKSIALAANTAIKSVVLTFTNNATQTFNISNETTKSGTWAGTSGNNGKRISRVDVTVRKVNSSSQSWTLSNFAYDSTAISAALGLSNVPFPWSAGSWSAYYTYAQSNSAIINAGYGDMYGGMTFISYQMKYNPSYSETKDFWKTKHYPFHAIKEGHELLCQFLTDLKFDDYLGMVSYDTTHRIESKISTSNPELPNIDISSKPLTNDYETVGKLMRFKQAAHYSDSTNMSGGLKDGIKLLDLHKRDGSRPAILLMTDGNSNTIDSGENTSLPSGWNWNTMFDYNGDGSADYTASDSQRTVVLKYVKQAVDKGYTVHAISVGNEADSDLLKAVAWLGNGHYVKVPGGQSVSDMEDLVTAAFTKIAAAVPPAKLVVTDE